MSLQYLGWTIQTGEHSPLEDAVASLRLYELKRKAWEKGGGAAAMCYDKEADNVAVALGGTADTAGAEGAAGAAPPKPPKPHTPPHRGATTKGKFASKGKFVQGKHKWSLGPGQKKSSGKKGAFAGLLNRHGM